MYFLKASEHHRSRALIWASENPLAAANVAPPILKLWPLKTDSYRDTGMPWS